MDTPSPPPSITTTITTTTLTTNLDPDDRIQPTHIPKQLPPPFTNGVLKRHKPHHHTPVVVTYKECLKNHAASMGGHALDGCGEFMPSSMSSPVDPTSIKCAACGCHRNFHRRDPDPPSFPPNPPPIHHVIEYQPHHRHHPPPPPPPPPPPISFAGARDPSLSPADSPSPPPISSSYYHGPSAPHMLLALSSGLPTPPPEHIPITGKKRFRTKFSQHQKEKMHELAERVGWKMQKKDEEIIIAFCNDIGVDKGVFKVWMHNNKMTFGKKDDGTDAQYQHHLDSGSSGGGVDFLNRNQHHHSQLQPPPLQNNNNDSISSGGGNVTGTNGSSSSS